MRNPENNLSENACTHILDTAALRNEATALTLLYKILEDFGCKWYVIGITKKGCIIRLRTSKKLFFLGKGKTLHQAMHSLLQKLIDYNH